MNREHEQRTDDLIELGVASEETKGHGGASQDLPIGQPSTGILDD